MAVEGDPSGPLGIIGLGSMGGERPVGLANSLGYLDQISSRVVDVIGNIAGGVRVSEPEPTRTKENRTDADHPRPGRRQLE